MDSLPERLRAWKDLASWANAGWNLPEHATAALSKITNEAASELDRLGAELRQKVAELARTKADAVEMEQSYQAQIEALRHMLKMARDALDGGLWDYGPGQDEHEQCDIVIAKLDAALAAPEAKG